MAEPEPDETELPNPGVYVADVIAAIDGSPAADQRRPVMLALKLGVVIAMSMLSIADTLLLDVEEDEPEDAPT